MYKIIMQKSELGNFEIFDPLVIHDISMNITALASVHLYNKQFSKKDSNNNLIF